MEGDVRRRSLRNRSYSPKGRQYATEKAREKLCSLARRLDRIKQDLCEAMNDPQDVDPTLVSRDHGSWLQTYETFLNVHQQYVELLPEEMRQHEISNFMKANAAYKGFKGEVEAWLLANLRQDFPESKEDHPTACLDSASKQGSEGSGASATSKLAELKLVVDQEKAGIIAEAAALKERREIEKAKLDISLREVEMNLKSKMAVVEAKARVLDEYEAGSRVSGHSRHSARTRLEPVVTNFPNPNAGAFVPNGRMPSNGDDLAGPPMQPPSNHHTCAVNSDVFAVARELRKPQVHISKFSGSPMDYRRFLRQFNSRVAAYATDDEERLNYLEQFTTGEANKIAVGYSHMGGTVAYEAILKEFKARYGDSEVIAAAYIKRALDWPVVKPDDSHGLDDLGIFLMECQYAVQEAGTSAAGVLEYSENIRRIVSKLPFYMHDKWRSDVMRTKEKGQVVTFAKLVEFVRWEARKAMDPTYGRESLSRSVPRQRAIDTRPVIRAKGLVTDVKSGPGPLKKGCERCGGSDHVLSECKKLKAESHDNKIEFLKSKGLCFACLKHGCRSRTCRNRLTCAVCQRRHPTVLHRDMDNLSSTSTVGATVGCSQATGAGVRKIAMSIVPVQIKAANSDLTIQTFALLDSGSTGTFCTEQLMNKLKMTGRRTALLLRTMGSEKRTESFVLEGLQVASHGNDADWIDLPSVLTQSSLPVTKEDIVTRDDLARWDYLSEVRSHVPVVHSDSDCQIGLLIGINAPKAMEPEKVIPSEGNGPFAVKTRLGWAVNGPLGEQEVNVNTVVHVVQATRMDSDLLDAVNRQIDYDFSERIIDDVEEHSQEDRQFLDSVAKSVKHENGHYTIGLPFKDSNVKMPCNRSQAEQRLKHLEKRFARDPDFHREYSEFMGTTISKGYACKVPVNAEPTEGRLWYLPHHGVYHPQKKKLRVVFDCAARYGGTSLNDELLSGPNLTNNLVGTLLRFRQGDTALVGDIEAMFSQVRVCPEDADFLRFLWWEDGDVSKPPQEYQQLTHLFGATSSPAVATYALLKTASDNEHQYGKEAAETLRRNCYVDDCIKSVDGADHAVGLQSELKGLANEGGFNMNRWLSNERTVMDAIPEEERAKEAKDLDFDLPTNRTLGVSWDAEMDQFVFLIDLKEKPATRRGILSVVSSIYDPLGLVAPCVLEAKGLLQELCRLGLSWDDPIPEEFEKKWDKWKTELCMLSEIKIYRGFKPKGFGEVVSAQLHHFPDASEAGYGVASFLRLVNANGDIHCCLVTGKSRVAPLKQVTIPRLELSAATVAVRVDSMLRRELDIKISESYFWTDSMTVLRYVVNTTARFHTFVSNRLSVIRDGSDISQWRYVPTRLNPGDEASRGLSAPDLVKDERWFHGPAFLSKPECEWPETPEISPQNLEADPEVKSACVSVSAAVVVGTTVAESDIGGVDRLIEYHSDWLRLKRCAAWWMRIKGALVSRIRLKKAGAPMTCTIDMSPLRFEDLKGAEHAVIEYVQGKHFAAELEALKGGVSVSKRSSLRSFDPILTNGLLRVGGRISRANLPEETLHTVILPKGCHVSRLVLRYVHLCVWHGGRNHMLSKLRTRWWIIQAPAAIRRVIRNCVGCRKQRARVGEQKMSDLPEDRLTADNPPFTSTGVDYFGPFEIKRGRSVVKCYGVMFTCLAARAVHLEVADSLDTSSFINALRRFLARRGQCRKLRSDNGTNFVGAQAELKRAIENWNLNQINDFMLQRDIDWAFNPPAGSHHGGVWERMIRSVRKVLNSVLGQQSTCKLDSECFRTILCEVEAVLNDRPITKLSDQHDDLEALTPNHILLMKRQPSLPPGLFVKEDMYAKRRWRQVQYISDLFWKRWVREYVPLLQERQKWLGVKRNLQIDDVVLVVDESSPRNSWLLGRVQEVLPDRNGVVRQVRVKTKVSVLTRPIDKLVLVLEQDENLD